MPTARDAAEELLEDHPDVEEPLRRTLEVDADGPWEFDDVPVDSGQFGEMVSREVVVERDGGYRIADRTAVRAALGDTVEEDVGDEEAQASSGLGLSIPAVEWPLTRRTTLAAVAVLAVVAAVRVVFVYEAVYRDVVTLMGNDPYKRLYWVEYLQANVAPTALGSLPEGVSQGGDTLMLVATWWASEVLGGTVESARTVLAWYPVVAALVTVATVFEIARQLTDDVRIALASALLLALTPIHAYRTALGFGDHHAFDYVWLGLTMLVIVRWERPVEARTPSLRERSGSRRFVTTTVTLGALLAIQSLSWVGAPMLLVPFVGYAFLRGAVAFRREASPLVAALPYLGGGALAGLAVLAVHLGLGWLPEFRALFPLVATGVAAAGVGYLEAGRRASLSPRLMLGSGAVLTAVTGTLAVAFVPGISRTLTRASGLFEARAIAESQSLFTTETGVFSGPLLYFGFVLFLALPFIVLGLYHALREDDPLWAAPAVYAVYFLFWSLVKVRFAGPMSLFAAVFAGVGFLRVATWVDLVRPVASFDERLSIESVPRPDGRQFALVGVLFLMIVSFSLVQIPIKQGQLAVDDETYRTAQWIDGYAETRSLEYPENNVFAPWDSVRIYNYFVNGQSLNYGFEQRNYRSFLASAAPARWYDRLRPRHGFVVFEGTGNGANGETIQDRMTDQSGPLPGFAHYRLIYHTDGGTRAVYQLVEGATIVGVTDNETGTAETTVDVASRSRTYRQTGSTNPYDVYTVTVPYSGTYEVNGRRVTVRDTAVRNGSRVYAHDREGIAHWPFDADSDKRVYDRVGGHQGTVTNATRTTAGLRGSAIEFDGDGHITTNVAPVGRFTVSMWIKPKRPNGTANSGFQSLLRGQDGVFLVRQESGAIGVVLPGVREGSMSGGTTPAGEWSHVAVTYDGTRRVLYVDGKRVATERIQAGPVKWEPPLAIGGERNRNNDFHGTIDEVRLYGRALDADAVRRLARNASDSA